MRYNDQISATVAYISDLDEGGNRCQFFKIDVKPVIFVCIQLLLIIDYILFSPNKGIHK